jgi:hypothetical protein
VRSAIGRCWLRGRLQPNLCKLLDTEELELHGEQAEHRILVDRHR